MDDLISRQAAIDAILAIKDYGNSDRANALGLAECAITTLPSAQPGIIRCKDCKHRPYKSEDQQGFGVEFPDETCPCQCEDGWYNWRPDDDWFCANADMRGEHE